MPERPQQPQQHIRVFLSSPGDVADERALARRLLKDELPYDPLLPRSSVAFDVVSWDDPAAPTPMDAALTPQEAVNRFGPKPSECDVVVVVLWSRMGTHLDVRAFRKADGAPYRSGTEWEFEDALNAPEARRPTVLVYRRTEDPPAKLSDPDLEDKRRQYRLVTQFFEDFRNPDASYRGGFTPYATSTEFKERLASDLKFLIRERLLREPVGAGGIASTAAVAPAWTDPPYPGLRPFESEEAAIFFGRGREVDALLAQLRDPARRFLAVVGASGSGKSSLVRAGLLPRLKDGAVEGSQHWLVLAFTPGMVSDDPFAALAVELDRALPLATGHRPTDIAKALSAGPQRLWEHAGKLLGDRPPGAVLLLFIDQFEELFTLAAEGRRRSFVELLNRATVDPRLRMVATLRADFLPQGMADPVLAPLLQAGTFPLGPPGPAALADMIRRPAERAGLALEEGLDDEILRDAGADPGEALPLLAFCLEELHRRTAPEHRLTLDAYRAMGRLRGAIGRRAGELLEEVGEAQGADLDAALPGLFRALVRVDAAGKAARQRATRDGLRALPDPVPRLVEALIGGRLLLAEDVAGRATVALTHEALIEEWPALREWLDRDRAHMQRVQRLLLHLASPDAEDRRHATEAFGAIGPAAAEAVPALAAALRDAEGNVRDAAAGALGAIGPAAAEAVPALAAALRDAEGNVRDAAAWALGAIGPAAAEAVPALAAALRDAEGNVRDAAAGALGAIGPAAVPALAAALRDAEGNVRDAAAGALGAIGPAAVPALAAALRDAEGNVRDAAAWALGRIGPAAAEAVPALAAALRDAEGYVRDTTAWALGRIGPAAAEAVPALAAALRDAEGNVRDAAAGALGAIGPAAVPALAAARGTSATPPPGPLGGSGRRRPRRCRR